jgi:dihydrofolate synthase/folylpolyglutamate synthase
MLGHIESMFEQILITEPPGPRSPVTIKQWRMNDLPSYLILKKNWKQALNKALSSCGPQDLLCVTGSLYLVGAVREELIKKKFVRCD